MDWLIVLLVFLLASFKTSRPIKYMKVGVIVPAFNEEETVADVVNVIKKVDYVNEVIVVDDGSTDNTAALAREAGARVISHSENKGKGEAIYTGFKNTDCDIIAFIDADLHNLTVKKVDAIIRPILEGKTEITKTKFARESGRVTELTAKPLLKYFFPEIHFEQPLSGQFAAKREVLKKINFESDYGVDVGIVLDADIQGISIQEVDIGEISHDLSPLKDLNLMANEVVRTIMSRASKYGRITIMDTIGNYIRMSILGLSLMILGFFTVFFVKPVPLFLGVIITIIGLVLAIFYLAKVIISSFKIFKKNPNHNLVKSFFKIHFPVIVSVIILILMVSTFLGAATFENGTISIEPNSRNLVLYTDNSNNNTIDVRGPFTVDAAIENESNIIRMPDEAMQTLGLSNSDTLIINSNSYHINTSRDGEPDVLRLPLEAKTFLDVSDGDIIQNSRLNKLFDGCVVLHNLVNETNTSINENYLIGSEYSDSNTFTVYIDGKEVQKSSGAFLENHTYDIYINGVSVESIDYYNNTLDNATYDFNESNHNVSIVFSESNSSSLKEFLYSSQGNFLELNF